VPALADQRKSLSVLLVEDDGLLRGSIRRALEAEGHRIARACDGQQAAAAIREESFDLLITDVLFPGIRTLEAVVEWSREPNRGRILGLSRFAPILPKYYLSLTRKLGMDVILAKPFDHGQLAEAIEQVFADPAARDSSRRRDESGAVA
jgi:CheY-like chemotaxis protein